MKLGVDFLFFCSMFSNSHHTKNKHFHSLLTFTPWNINSGFYSFAGRLNKNEQNIRECVCMCVCLCILKQLACLWLHKRTLKYIQTHTHTHKLYHWLRTYTDSPRHSCLNLKQAKLMENFKISFSFSFYAIDFFLKYYCCMLFIKKIRNRNK